MIRPPPTSTLFPYTTLFRSRPRARAARSAPRRVAQRSGAVGGCDRRSQRMARGSREAGSAGGAGGREGGERPAVGGALLLAAAYAVRPRSGDQARRGAEELARIRQAEAAGGRRTGEERREGDREQQPGREIAARGYTNQQRRSPAPGRLGDGERQRAQCAVRRAPEDTTGSSPVSDDNDRLVPPDDGSASRAAQAQ